MITKQTCLAISMFTCFASVWAQDNTQTQSGNATQVTSERQTHLVVVKGAEGTPEFGEQFKQWADQWADVASKAGATFFPIGDSEETNDLEQLKSTLESLPKEGTQPVWIVLIGHGTFSMGTAKFNLRGPDVSAQDLSTWLTPIKRPLVIVNCASSSGPFINQLSAQNRVIVTATKSGSQYNFARFGEHFANAIASMDSDLDHDEAVSVQEAFLRANSGVRDFYNAESRIATEHALIDDNGDGLGTPANMFRGIRPIAKAKDGAKLDGTFASRLTLSPTGKHLPLTDAEITLRDELESQLDQVRQKKEHMDPAEFDKIVEPILLKLAALYQRAEERVPSKK
jgi:hypothetical protein